MQNLMKQKLFFILFIMITSLNADWNSKFIRLKDSYHNYIYGSNNLSEQEMKKQFIDDIWNDLLEKLEKTIEYNKKFENAPKDSWIGEDKKDIKEDIDEIFSEIITILTDNNVLKYKDDIANYQKKISDNKYQILEFREEKIVAPEKSLIYTTKAGFDEKINNLKDENKIFLKKIDLIKNNLKKSFHNIGVELSSKQIDTLLIRVDGDDMIYISLTMDILKSITDRILELMNESGEELSQAKKYYGMHFVLLQLVVYIEQDYINKLNNIYIKNIDNVISKAKNMIIKTKKLLNIEENDSRRDIYNKNLEAQRLTLKVANLYKKDLIKSRNNMKKAQKISEKNLAVAKNSFYTVSLSSNLYKIILDSQNMFQKISKIQIPNIVPFHNKQIKNKYSELRELIK